MEQWDGPTHADYWTAWTASAAARDMSGVALSGWMVPVNPVPNTNDLHALIGWVEPPGSAWGCGAFQMSAAPPSLAWRSPESVPLAAELHDADVPQVACPVQVSVPTVQRRDICQ